MTLRTDITHTRTLGQVLQVSAIGLGTAGMTVAAEPGAPNRKEMIAVLRGAVEEGVTFFDTAEVLGPYTTEALVEQSVMVALAFGVHAAFPDLQQARRATVPVGWAVPVKTAS